MFATKKQLKFIHQIEEKLNVKFKGVFIDEANEFIKENLEAYNRFRYYSKRDIRDDMDTLDMLGYLDMKYDFY